ncbi:Heat shock protein SSA4 [Pseudocercospora fuligena]|uniref:Heat shock protein SSA4 n=1 Tax=Pseudocercospora fuligena TaxID=685502 RepID=A0A8H6RI35_9PEZI|nr:Heat shock protein SSA4 [Pseudocercospora fuligena]
MTARAAKRQRLLEPTPSASRHRMIVGIDYGTTYTDTGISFVTTDKTELEDISVIRTWPGKDGEWKTPTRIAYRTENPKLQADSWGYQVKPTMIPCSWTKLLLDAETIRQESDDPELEAAIDSGCLRLPPGLTAQRVAGDFLSKVYEHMRSKLVKELGQEVFDSTPMDCWLTVLAVWSDRAQSLTKAAAMQAGFAVRTGDTISVIPEPEAAAVSVLRSMARSDSLSNIQAGETILICDCGGGTVDITSYSIVETEPIPVFEEACVGTGGKCGASSIDRSLQKLMSERFGAAWDDLPLRQRGPGSRFMNEWENVKRGFGEPGAEDEPEVYLVLEGDHDDKFYDSDENTVRFTNDDLKGVFETTMEEVLNLIAKQKGSIEEGGKKLDRIALVGGFGDSSYLHSRVKDWALRNGNIDVVCPAHPQAAIVRGAALRGLLGMAPRKKRCRRHYGISLGLPFREGVDPQDLAYVDTWTGEKRCSKRMIWLFNKGEDITEATVRRTSAYSTVAVGASRHVEFTLYSCNLDMAPEYIDQSLEENGMISIYLDRSSMRHLQSKNGYYKVDTEVEILFGSKSGTLDVKVIRDGKVKGNATIVYN